LSAMHPRHGFIIRPLIDCRRSELRGYLDDRHIPYVTDETNEDVTIPRNRVRAELIPLLEQRFNPAVVEVLADEAELAREEWAWMMDVARVPQAGDDVTAAGRAPEGVALRIDALRAAPVALRRLIVWRAMNAAAAGRPVGFEHVRAVLRLLDSSRPDASVDAPGHRVQRIGDTLVLRNNGASGGADAASGFHYPLSVPGEVRLPEARCVVSAEAAPAGVGAEFLSSSGDQTVAIVRSDVCPGPLAVRNRRPGDRFRPPGLAGRKKLQDFFVDRKVARHHRDAVPIVVDERDRIVWVAGYAIDDQFRVTDPTQAVLILRLKPVGGSV